MSHTLLFDDGRPAPVRQSPLPPFDPSTPGEGDVHTVPPPEWLAIDKAHDPLWVSADFNGVNLNASRWGTPPMLEGANSTPITMLMTPMLPMYPRFWQDADLTEHAERGYRHFVISSGGTPGNDWNFAANGYAPSPADVVSWAQYVQSWGFEIIHWGAHRLQCPYLSALVDAHAIAWHLIGGESDRHIATKEQFDALVRDNLSIADGIPCAAHFTANYPEGFPRDTFLTTWADFDGKLHLFWQADQDNSAGKQGAMLYYARQRVALGRWGGDGRPAPNSRVIAFETMASNQLKGQCTEEYGCLRSLELNYCTRDDARVPPVYGFGNGGRYPDGTAI